MTLFIQQFLLNSLIFACIFIIGTLILRLGKFEIYNPNTTFFILVFGILSLLVTISAIFFSSFRTILLGVPILLVLSFILYPRKLLQKTLPQGPSAFNQLCFEWFFVQSIAFGLYFFASHFNPADYANVPSRDWAYYARASYQLVSTGVETSTYDAFFPNANKIEPYHYFDLWLNGIVSKITGNPNLYTLTYLVYPLGVSVTWAGLCALISLHRPVTRLDKVLAFFGLLVVGIIGSATKGFSTFMDHLTHWQLLADIPANWLLYNLWSFPKLFPIYWFVIASFVFIIRRDSISSILILLCLCFCYTPCAPAVLLGIAIFAVLRVLLVSKWDKTIESILIMVLATVVFFGLFYFVFHSGHTLDTVSAEESFLKMTKRGVRYFFDVTVQTLNIYFLWIAPLLVYLLYALISRAKRNDLVLFLKSNKEVIIYIGSLFFASIFVWGFFRWLQDADQMYTNFGIVILNIMIVLAYSMVIKSFSWATVRYLLAGYYVVIACYAMSPSIRYGSNFIPEKLYGDVFLKEVEKASPDLSNKSAFLFSEEDYKNPIHAEVEILGQYLSLFRSDIVPVSLSIFKMSIFKSTQRIPEGILTNPFYVFVNGQKQNGSFTSIEQSQCDFIHKFGINHIIIKKMDDLPPCLSVKSKIVDEASGQILIILQSKD